MENKLYIKLMTFFSKKALTAFFVICICICPGYTFSQESGECSSSAGDQSEDYAHPGPEIGITLKLLIEGFFNGIDKQVSDRINGYLRFTVPPFNVADSSGGDMDSIGIAHLNFPFAQDGNYYIEVNHRNSIETWSKNGINLQRGVDATYDYTVSDQQAYGNNLKLKGNKWCIFSGDVNQDGNIDLTDLVIIFNDAGSFSTGYVISDVNGDTVVDLPDLLICYNNAATFVSKMVP